MISNTEASRMNRERPLSTIYIEVLVLMKFTVFTKSIAVLSTTLLTDIGKRISKAKT
jgi:hypothetical protein